MILYSKKCIHNCALIKVDWLAACIALRVVGTVMSFSSGVGVQFYSSPAKGKQGKDTPLTFLS
jgi:hypothetical protein